MKRAIYLFCAISFLLIGLQSSAQKRINPFAFIESSTDSSSLVFIQTYRSTSKEGEDLAELYYAIKERAVNKGANCFRLKDFKRDSTGRIQLVLSTYYGGQAFLESNSQKHEKNTVYIISDGDFSRKTYTFKINGAPKEITSGTYFKRKIEENGKVKINKGGFLGTTVSVGWAENKSSRFYSLSGFGLVNSSMGVGIAPGNYGRPGVGIAFTTGKINALEEDFGYLLTQILEEKQE